MNREVKQRLGWIQLYQQTHNAGLTCRRCGISRPTLRKWLNRYEKLGIVGLESISRRPYNSPNIKLTVDIENQILELRNARNLGARRLQSELGRLHNISLSIATIHKVLTNHKAKPVKRFRKKQDFIRYEKAIPGERVQMDTCKITNNIYQYTAIDDCTRLRVLRVYKKRTATNTLDFIEHLLLEMPFPIQRIQTDRGLEFFAIQVQKRLQYYGIKFRPNKPKSPHLNGKVERSQQTDKTEFYATLDIDNMNLDEINIELGDWQHYYNWQRPHSAHNGKTPMDKCSKLSSITPFWDEVHTHYHKENERIQLANYRQDLALRKLEIKA